MKRKRKGNEIEKNVNVSFSTKRNQDKTAKNVFFLIQLRVLKIDIHSEFCILSLYI